MRATSRTASLALLIVAACSAGDDTDGARTLCAEGGALNTCTAPPPTPEGVCWKLVDCAAIPLDAQNGRDWTNCVSDIERLRSDSEQLVIECITASSCDALKPDPMNGNIGCLLLGDL